MAAPKLAKVGPSSSGRNGWVSPLAKASTMVVKAARAPPEKPSGSKLGSAARIAATPGLAVGSTVERMPPGAVTEDEGRCGAGAPALGSGITLSLPDWAGASPIRGVLLAGGGGGVNGSLRGGRSLP